MRNVNLNGEITKIADRLKTARKTKQNKLQRTKI